MADRKLSYEVNVDSTKGQTGIKSFARTVRQELKNIEGDFDDTATAGERVATVLSRMAGELDTELARAADAADALSQALGPELAAKADVGSIVSDFGRMGLTFEEITADADKLAAALREMDEVQMRGLDRGLGGVSTKFGQIDDSVRGSRSVLANAIGNMTQDVGALAGVAGTAGVAIGQMGEYMADAVSSGERFGSVLTNFGKIAGPITGLMLAMQAISDVMGSMKASDAFDAEQVDKFSAAMREGVTFANELHDTIQQTGELLIRTRFDVGIENVLTPWKVFTEQTRDLIPVMATLGVTTADFMRFIDDPAAFRAFQRAMIDQGLITKDNLVAFTSLEQGVEDYRKTQENAADAAEVLNQVLQITPQIASDATRAFLQATDPIKSFPDEFLRIGRALATGFRPTVADLETVTEGLGVELPEALALGEQAYNDQQAAIKEWKQATNAAVDESIRIVEEYAAAIEDAALKIAGAEGDLRDLAGVFSQIGTRQDALSAIFDWKNRPLEVEGQVRDIALAIDDLSETGKDAEVSPEVNADALMDALDALRPQIQTRIVDTFSAGGVDAATKMAQDYIAQVAEELDIPPAEAARLLGLDNIPAVIQVAVDQASLANAQAQLDILTGLTGATPLTATIQMGLDAGTITPEQAQIITQDQLGDLGVDIPAELRVKTSKRELREAYRALGVDPDAPIQQPVEPTGLVEMAGTIQEGPGGRGWPPIEVPVVPVLVPGDFTTGGVPGPRSPTPTGLLRATSAETPVGFAAGSTIVPVPVGPTRVEVDVNLNAQGAIIGDPFATMRAIEDGMRRAARLMPVSP